MTKLEQAARQIIVDWDSGIHLYEAITALREALAEQERKAKYDERFERLEKFEQAEQEPVAYLCDGARYKVLGEDRSGYGRILGLPESLAGQWVALVDATDGKHLRATPVRTKDLTADEIWEALHDKGLMEGIRAVIAADREKNK